ncbi:hypothetical protein CAPTEDRAFT_224893 [Capitella teleta]|uniref:Uncharacterized protein n=1 Tax=Capitella teleta TaxID=283909 RepID=R7V8E4_CAPTE|nr:hypothetical protein CAPTEDRAFT_224893 [Capitella teleta]|eukprot:ELU14819.1 hypothetical protein CAPTEDRAFT_224893 [Capitella teleta]
MKKDGIQTRNRKMSTKSKKNRKGSGSSSCMDLLKPTSFQDKAFASFGCQPPSAAQFQHGMPTPMPTYGSLGHSFMPTSGHHSAMHAHPGNAFAAGSSSSHVGGAGFSLSPAPPHHSGHSFSNIPASGLNLSTNSSMDAFTICKNVQNSLSVFIAK